MSVLFRCWRVWCVWGVVLLCLLPAQAGAREATSGPVKVVYHVSEGIDQATRALHNIRNHLDADPTVKITVVALGDGVDFLLNGAKDKHGNPFDVTVQTLVDRGVDFRVCNNTLTSRGISRDQVIPEARLVPAGMAELGRLQYQEGYSYIKP